MDSPLDDLWTTCEWLPSKWAPNVCNEGNFGQRTPPSDLSWAEIAETAIQTPRSCSGPPPHASLAPVSAGSCTCKNFGVGNGRDIQFRKNTKTQCWQAPGLVAHHHALAALWQDLTTTASFIHHQNLSECSRKPWTMSKKRTLPVLQFAIICLYQETA